MRFSRQHEYMEFLKKRYLSSKYEKLKRYIIHLEINQKCNCTSTRFMKKQFFLLTLQNSSKGLTHFDE